MDAAGDPGILPKKVSVLRSKTTHVTANITRLLLRCTKQNPRYLNPVRIICRAATRSETQKLRHRAVFLPRDKTLA